MPDAAARIRPAARSPTLPVLNNGGVLSFAHGLFRVTSKVRFLGREHFPAAGSACLIAVAHVTHYDPVVVSALSRRRIAWWARAEFYVSQGVRWFMRNAGCIRIDRGGPALPGVRDALAALASGRTVGLFPEGGLRGADNSVLTGGTMRAGVATLARRSGAAVVPCVALGGEQFTRVLPWLPFRTGRLAIAYGTPLKPTDAERKPGRRGRSAFAARVADSMRALYAELVAADPTLALKAGVGEGDVPPAGSPLPWSMTRPTKTSLTENRLTENRPRA